MAFMEVILLERVDSLGDMGETVRVKPGYARNFLLPQKKALRATNENKAFYDAKRAELEKRNAEKRAEAETLSKKLEGFKASVIRNAAEGGALYGSVTTRDVAEALTTQSKIKVDRAQVLLNLGFKTIGLFEVPVALHPEVKVMVTVNIARTEEEAKIQAKTGKALVAVDDRTAEANARAEAEAAAAAKAEKAALMEAEGLAVESEREEAAEEKKAKKTKKVDDADAADAANDDAE
jgi:large subunit ribosomal protein L9